MDIGYITSQIHLIKSNNISYKFRYRWIFVGKYWIITSYFLSFVQPFFNQEGNIQIEFILFLVLK